MSNTAFQAVMIDVFDRRGEKRLTLDEERAAIASARFGDQFATMALIYAYAPALRGAVAQYRSAGGAWGEDANSSHSEDLRSSAVAGLIEAIHAFDGEKYDRLAAIAKGYIADSISSTLVSPVSFSIPSRSLKRFYGILRAADGNIYEGARIAPEYEMKSETFLSILSAVRDVASFEGLSEQNDDEGSNSDGAVDASAHPVWNGQYADADDRILVEAAFAAVDTLESDVVRLGYGFSDYEPVPDAEIAHRLGFSRQKVQRTRSAALDKMRGSLAIAVEGAPVDVCGSTSTKVHRRWGQVVGSRRPTAA